MNDYDPIEAYGKPLNDDGLLNRIGFPPTYRQFDALQNGLEEARKAAAYWETQHAAISEQLRAHINDLETERDDARRELGRLWDLHIAVKEVLGNRTEDRNKWRTRARTAEGRAGKLLEDVRYWQDAYDRSEKRVVKAQDSGG